MPPKETTLLNGRVSLIQSEGGLRVSMDTVLLAASVTLREGDHILDMGCGSGGVGLCILERLKSLNLSLTGIDKADELIALARQNGVSHNFMVGDIMDRDLFPAQTFDHIVCNPPYYEVGKRQASPDALRENAFSHAINLNDWIDAGLYWVKHGGSLTFIHRADSLDKILQSAGNRFGAIEIWPIHSKAQEPAIRVIVKMIRNRKSPLTLHPPIIMFDETGAESLRSKRILRDGEGLI